MPRTGATATATSPTARTPATTPAPAPDADTADATGGAGAMPTLRAVDRDAWRAWLAAHGDTAAEVWLVLPHARSATPSVTHREAIEEALCAGWIDSHARKHDAGSWCLRFTPRKATSAWSTVNRDLVARLTAEGRMTPRGEAAVELAKRTGTWSLLAEAQAGVVPDDLRARLDADPVAAAHFAAFSPSARRAILEWLVRAKRPETRLRRIARTVEAAARNERP